MPDWLQTSRGEPAVSVNIEPPHQPETGDSAAGGLDWLHGLAPPSPGAAEVPALTREKPSGRARNKAMAGVANGEEVDWIGAALKGDVPATSAAVMTAKETPGSQEGGDWLVVARTSGQNKRKSSPDPSARSAAAALATQGGWMSSGKLGLSTRDDSDDDVGGRMRSGGSTAAAASAPKKKRKHGASSPTASGPGGWLSSGVLGVPVDDNSSEDRGDGVGDGGGGNDYGRGIGVTVETQTEDDIKAVTEEGTIEKGNAPKLPPWAKPWTPPPKPEVIPNTNSEMASAPSGGTEKEVK